MDINNFSMNDVFKRPIKESIGKLRYDGIKN